PAVNHDSIGGDEITGAQFDDVAGDNLLDRHRDDRAVPPHISVNRYRMPQSVGGNFGPMLLHHVQDDRERDDRDNKRETGDVADESGYRRRNEQNGDQRFQQPFDQLANDTAGGNLGNGVAAEPAQALVRLLLRQPRRATAEPGK